MVDHPIPPAVTTISGVEVPAEVRANEIALRGGWFPFLNLNPSADIVYRRALGPIGEVSVGALFDTDPPLIIPSLGNSNRTGGHLGWKKRWANLDWFQAATVFKLYYGRFDPTHGGAQDEHLGLYVSAPLGLSSGGWMLVLNPGGALLRRSTSGYVFVPGGEIAVRAPLGQAGFTVGADFSQDPAGGRSPPPLPNAELDFPLWAGARAAIGLRFFSFDPAVTAPGLHLSLRAGF